MTIKGVLMALVAAIAVVVPGSAVAAGLDDPPGEPQAAPVVPVGLRENPYQPTGRSVPRCF